MKKIIILITIVFFLKPIFPLVEYAIRYDYISKVLCINKDKPMMHCNGKCHLMKELAKQAESEKPISSDKKDNTKHVEVLFYKDIVSLLNHSNSWQFKIPVYDSYSNLYFLENTFSVFHPPTVA